MSSVLRIIFSVIFSRVVSEALNVVMRFCCVCRVIEGRELIIVD